MKKSKNRWIDRLLAWVLTFVMIFGLLGNTGMIVNAAQVSTDLITVTSTVTTSDGEEVPENAMLYFAASDQESKSCRLGESVELVSGVSYQVEIKAKGYAPYVTTFIPSTENHVITATLNVKSVKVTFKVVDKNNAPVEGMSLEINNQNPVQVGKNGEYVYTAKEGTVYSGIVSGGSYAEKSFSGTADRDKTEIIMMQARTCTAKIRVKDRATDHYLQNAEITLKSTDGEIQAQKSEVDGVYTATVEEGIAYTIQASGDGFSKGSVESVYFDANNIEKEVTVEPQEFSIVSDANQNTYPNGTATVQFAKEYTTIKENGYSYEWVTTGPIVWENGTVKVNGGVGEGTVKAVLKYEGKTCRESNSISVTVGKGTIENHSNVEVVGEKVDAKTVKLRFTNIKEKVQATVTVSKGNLGDAEIKQSYTIEAGSEKEIDFSVRKKLQGKIHIGVTFEGDNYDYVPATKEFDEDYFVSEPFEAKINETELVYGDDREIKIVPTESAVVNENSTFSYSIVDDKGQPIQTDVISIDETGAIKILNANKEDQKVNIKVTRNEDTTNYWAEASCVIKDVKVSQKELDPIGKVTYKLDGEAFYKGDPNIEALGTIDVQPENATVDNDKGVLEQKDTGKIEVKATLKLPAEDADTYSADKDEITINQYKLVNKFSELGDVRNYKLPEQKPTQKIANGEFEVKPKTLTVQIVNKNNKEQNPAVGTVYYQDLDNSQAVLPDNLEIAVDGLVKKEDLEKYILPLEITPVSGLHNVGIHEETFKVNLEDKVKPNDREMVNYVFNGKHRWGDLEVLQEEISENLNSVVSYDGTNVYTQVKDNNNVAWVKSEDGTLRVNIEKDYSTRYDAVLLNGTSTNLTNDGITSEELKNILKPEGLEVQLAKSKENGFQNKSKSFTIPVKLDGKVPTVTFPEELEESVPVMDNFLKSLSFGAFDNAVYTADITITDTEAGFTPAKNQYFVWKLEDKDLSEDGVVEETTIKSKVESIEQWENFSSDTASVCNGTYSVKVGEAEPGSADVVEGNYIILVKAVDNVNNCRVYASNGVVIDVKQPTLTVIFEGGKQAYYNGDVRYHIKVTDGEGLGVSGVKTVEWTVTCNGKKVEKNSGSENEKEGSPKYSLKELEKGINLDNIINSEFCNSNDVQLTVTAKDRAGNVVVSENYDLIIDATPPEITVTYDNLDVKNGIYFKNGRTATVVFEERNLDKDGATFDLTLEDGRAFEKLTVKRLNEELNAVGGKAYWRDDDSEKNKPEKEYTDDRTNSVIVEFSGDNHYSNFVPHCTDKAGNENKEVIYPENQNIASATTEFVVDKKAPVINGIHYTTGDSAVRVGKTENERIYKNQTIDAVITVTEHNFALTDKNKTLKQFAKDQVNYSVKYNKVGENQTIPDYNAQANQTANWISNGDVRTSEAFVYNNDANYTTKFYYEDLAGNSAVWNEEYFTVDKTAPTGTVQVGSRSVVSQFFNSITFFLYSKVQIPVNFTGADHTSPILPLVYHKAYTPLNLEQVKAVKNWTQGTGFQVNENSQVVPYLKVEDRAGNITYLSSNEIAIADNTAPLNKDKSKPIITVTTGQPPHDIFNQDVSFAIHAEDPVVGDTYSGLATVKYQVLNGNTVTQENTYDYTSNTNRTRVVDKNEMVKATVNNSNHVRIKVTATDNAGNVTEEIKDIKIDITKPEISVTFNNKNGLSGKYYKDTRIATVVVKERNFDPNSVQINVVNTHGTKAEISGWSHSAGAGESDDATHTATIAFVSDGDYTFTVDCTDLAMNKAANPYKSEEFTVDKTIPTISVSYDNDNAQNGNYYKASRTATITINEHNFNAGDVKVTTTASNGRTPGVSGWSGSGDRHTATVEFDSDADYTFDISYIDMAGNSAAEYDQDRFTVDLTKPSMEITGVANKSANKGTVAPVITVSDTNYIASGVTISLTGANRGKIDTSSMVSRTNSENGQIITFRNFGSNMDDIYTLVAKSVDKAGNEITQSITFSVNRDGSAYNINQSTKDLIEKGFTNNPQDIVIEEVNVDTLEFIEISYSKDGKIVKLTEGKDYKVEAEGGEGQWKKYTYTIFAKCFNEEGEYSINISSTDRAENISNNKVQSVNVDFVVDMTAPIMAVSNLENRGRYKENRHEYTLNVKDNTMLTMVQIYLDDKLFKTYEVVDGKLVNIEDPSDVLEIENGKVYLGIDSKNMYQKIKLVSTDAAGNVSETEDYNVLVTSSNLVQFYMNKPLFYGSIIAVIAACGIIIFLILKKKRA